MTTLRRVPDLLAALRSDLTDAGFTTDGLAAFLGPVASAALHREQTVPAMRACAADDVPLATMIRLWCLGRGAPEPEVARAHPRTGPGGLTELGLLETDGNLCRARFDLRPYADEQHDWWVASDLSELAIGGPLPADHVLGIGGASTTLASWTPRRAVRTVLDLGTGCGVQTLHLAAHAEHLVATDVSTRATELAQWNAALNRVDLDVKVGSLFEPVAGQQFSMIVSNPPFVITPRTEDMPAYEYRDGGMVGDDLVRTVVSQIEAHLEPGGIAQLLGNWEVRDGQDWQQVVGAWLAPTGLDAWVVQRERQDPAQYAELWARDGGHRPGTSAYEKMYADWLDDFASRDVDWVGFGVLTLQRPVTDRAPFRVLEEMTGAVNAPMGPAVDAELRALTWVAEHPGDVLDEHWQVAGDVTEVRYYQPGEPDPALIRLTQGGGLRREVTLDTAMAGFVGVADGELTPRQALTAIAQLLDQPEPELIQRCLPALTRLVETGFLQPAAGGESDPPQGT